MYTVNVEWEHNDEPRDTTDDDVIGEYDDFRTAWLVGIRFHVQRIFLCCEAFWDDEGRPMERLLAKAGEILGEKDEAKLRALTEEYSAITEEVIGKGDRQARGDGPRLHVDVTEKPSAATAARDLASVLGDREKEMTQYRRLQDEMRERRATPHRGDA